MCVWSAPPPLTDRTAADSQKLLGVPPAALDGYNFAYQGIWGIWEGFRPARPQVSVQPTPRLAQRGLLLDVPPAPIPNLILETASTRSHSRAGRRTRPGGGGGGGGGVDTQNDEFALAVNSLLVQTAPEQLAWSPAVPTGKLAQRRLILRLCEWSLAEEDMGRLVRELEHKGRFAQAACWLVFTRKYREAVELLMRSEGAWQGLRCSFGFRD